MVMKNRILAFAFLMLGTLAFVSCQKDKTEDGVSLRTDELAYLQGHFASVDEEGVLTIMAGWQLNEADPGELSMKADSYEAAAAIFKKIILPEANVEESENSLIWHLTGKDGKAQGDAVLSKASGDKVAVLTMPASATLVDRVNFIPHSLWPVNGEYEYREELDDFYLFNVVKVKVNFSQKPGSIYCRGNHGTGGFLVIREYDEETNTWGLLLQLPNIDYSLFDDILPKANVYEFLNRAPTLETFQLVVKIYNDNKELFDKEMDKAGFPDRHTSILINNSHTYWFDSGGYNTQTKKIKECLVYRFGFDGPKDHWPFESSDKYLVLK